jgi:hypothetical protein
VGVVAVVPTGAMTGAALFFAAATGGLATTAVGLFAAACVGRYLATTVGSSSAIDVSGSRDQVSSLPNSEIPR